MKSLSTSLWILAIAALIALPGCGDPDPEDDNAQDEDKQGEGEDDHAHPTHGPHDGDLIELGNEEYHAEIVRSETAVTVYLLDGAAKMGPTIEGESINLNLSHHGDAKQYALTGVADEDAPGKFAEFTSSDEEMLAIVKEDNHLDISVSIEIDGTNFRGTLAHSHP
jgi:hypothetical protein